MCIQYDDTYRFMYTVEVEEEGRPLLPKPSIATAQVRLQSKDQPVHKHSGFPTASPSFHNLSAPV